MKTLWYAIYIFKIRVAISSAYGKIQVLWGSRPSIIKDLEGFSTFGTSLWVPEDDITLNCLPSVLMRHIRMKYDDSLQSRLKERF